MLITLNGLPHRLLENSTIADLLTTLNHAGKRLAVERNGEIVPRSLHLTTVLAQGDAVEIVVAVGGG